MKDEEITSDTDDGYTQARAEYLRGQPGVVRCLADALELTHEETLKIVDAIADDEVIDEILNLRGVTFPEITHDYPPYWAFEVDFGVESGVPLPILRTGMVQGLRRQANFAMRTSATKKVET
jgi:hypothetical protein